MERKELGGIRAKYRVLCGVLDERGRRVWAAAEARSLPYGGMSLVARATGLSRTTIHTGMRALKDRPRKTIGVGRSRKATTIHPFRMHQGNWWNQRQGAPRNRPYGELARAPATWPTRCSGK